MKEEKNMGITAKKDNDFPEWYSQMIVKAELVDYTSVSGCFAYRPYGYAIWEKMVREIDAKLKELGVQNVYFPLFIPEKLLKKEAKHVEGFAPEVAWVTEAGHTKLDERLAIRPTSETIMYESYSKWIRSWRDLPIKYNQWNNVVRWEFKHPTPLIRTREFLWCEGHSAFSTRKEAEQEITDMMTLWKDVTENLLALKGVSGKKGEAEKFAGALASYSIEYLLPNGKTAQGPDAHFDGQNFAKVFDINFLDKNGKKDFAWQNTWAFTTRMIGLLAMTHSDDRGLVLPPNIAPIQAVIVPIMFEDSKEKVIDAANKLKKQLEAYITVKLDDRDEYNPGWKFNEWEMKGVPVRIEIGPRDLAKKQAVIVRRDNGEKKTVKLTSVNAAIKKMLEEMQQKLLKNSADSLQKNILSVSNIKEISAAVNKKKMGKGFFCGSEKCEEKIKKTEAKSLCIELSGKKGKCLVCGNQSNLAYFGKSY
ncbi:proline--tRNA ligase [Candidatus Woesearchaeota archaeon]|nr:proline--tRNA ligase [Candidatus Woesearchaeota archaeon]|tara:strand:- start:386 stop:1816 length:1431 start_codon:yes stop_codon:yes gene_type:complete